MDELVAELAELLETDKVNKLKIIVRRAESFITTTTGTEEWKDIDPDLQMEVALIMWNKLGIDGESLHSEGSYSSQFETLPKMLQVRLNRFNKAKALGSKVWE